MLSLTWVLVRICRRVVQAAVIEPQFAAESLDVIWRLFVIGDR